MMDFSKPTEFDAAPFEEVRSVCLDCVRCPLHEQRTQVVFGTGPVPCPLMIIGEGPGQQEDDSGLPFVGRAGQLLTKILESVGINRVTDAYITNVVKCRPPQNRTPLPSEIATCNPYLRRQIQEIKPRVLVLLGAPSLKTVLEETLPISKVRGSWRKAEVPYMDEPLYIMPMFHPSYLLRNDSKERGSPKWLTWQDIREVKTALDYYRQTL